MRYRMGGRRSRKNSGGADFSVAVAEGVKIGAPAVFSKKGGKLCKGRA